MSTLLEYECQVPVGGYDIITMEEDALDPRDRPKTWKILQPRSERTRRFDLFKVSSSAFLEFAQTPATPEAIKDFADRYGPLEPESGLFRGRGRQLYAGLGISQWSFKIGDMRRTIELWQMSKRTGDFSKIIRAVQKNLVHLGDFVPGVPVELLLKGDPLNASASLCIRPHSLLHALWAQLLLEIAGNANLNACRQCRKWFTVEAGQGRSDKAYCSNACRMRAYRKRKVSG